MKTERGVGEGGGECGREGRRRDWEEKGENKLCVSVRFAASKRRQSYLCNAYFLISSNSLCHSTLIITTT